MNLKKGVRQSTPKNKCSLVGILIFFLCGLNSFAQTGDLVTSVETESGVLSGGVTIDNSITGFTGTGYVTNFKNAPDNVKVIVTVPTTAFYSIYIRYNSGGDKYQFVDVNGTGASSVYFPQTTDWSTTDAGKYFLNAGENAVTIQDNWGWMDVDQILVYTTSMNSYNNIAESPVDPKASTATKSLYNFLLSQFGEKIISGQTDGYYTNIKTITGKSPLLRTWDFQHFTEGYPYLWKDGGHSFGIDTGDKSPENAIAWYKSTGGKGIVGFRWHWHSPSGGTVGTNTFYTEYTTFDITKAVQSGTPEYALIIRDIDAIAVQLKKLQAANIPVLWRPLHEAGGGWFWWGAKGGAACKKLYEILYDRITNFHQIHNLIWVWSTPETDWYPGNEKVDIVGHDSYPGAYNYGNQKNAFDTYFSLTKGEKLITMSENGPVPDPDACLDFDASWSYFMSWSDLVLSQNSNEHLIAVYNNPRVLTLENDTIPMITSITNASICGSEAVTLSATSNFGIVNWYDAPTGGNLIATGTSYTTPVLSLPATYYVEASYNDQPGQVKRSAVTAIASSPITMASEISGSSVVCQGSKSIVYSVPYNENVVSWNWTLPPGASAVDATSTNTIMVNFSTNAQLGNITVKGSNACGDGPESTFAIDVNTLPDAAGNISGSALVCQSVENVLYTVPEIPGANSYIWTLPSGATGSSSTNRILVNFNGTTSTSASIKVNGNNDCGSGLESSMPVTIKMRPSTAGNISGLSSVCRNSGNATYSVPTISGATSYMWTLSPGLSGTSTSRSITISFDGAAVLENLKVKGLNDCGEGMENTLEITINNIPETPVINLNNGIAESSAATGNQWYYNNSMITNAINETYNATRAGDYYTIVSLNGCSSEPSNTITVFRTDAKNVFENQGICIFPNPIEKGKTRISISEIDFAENTIVKIFDVNGKLVHSGFIIGQMIDLGKGIEAGIYVVNVIVNDKIYSEKLIVK